MNNKHIFTPKSRSAELTSKLKGDFKEFVFSMTPFRVWGKTSKNKFFVPTNYLIIGISIYISLFSTNSFAQTLPIDTTAGWYLSWNDEFDYEDSQLDDNWESQNGPSGHILCSRWRENAVVKDGILELQARKESRGGQEWTAGNIWTKKWFKYGYFECRYKYAGASGTNNSFWFMTRGDDPEVGKRFEIDVNEGHYPNEVNTNLHNWTDINDDGTHPNNQLAYTLGVNPDIQIELETPITTSKIRFRSNHGNYFHIREFRAYGPNNGNYPNVLSETADSDVNGLSNYVREAGTKITVSGVLRDEFNKERMADGNVLSTSWVSQAEGEKWIEIEFIEAKEIGCIQFINGWKKDNIWMSLISQFSLEYYNGTDWVEFHSFDVKDDYDLSAEYHVYGLLWTETELKYYVDGKLIRSIPNEYCITSAPIWLSLAILEYAGEVTDAIDGTSMKVDYVRVYDKEASSQAEAVESIEASRIYPNPTKGNLFIRNELPDSIHSVYSATGKKILETSTNPINVSSLQNGIYVLISENGTQQRVEKFIVN